MGDNTLAIFGGDKTIRYEFEKYNPIGDEEVAAAASVIQSGTLSQFLGTWSDDFFGGPKVLEFERDCARYFGVEHAVTVNSWTSGLIAAVGAIGIEPGDEVIVSPWTMSASATAIIHWNAIPVFADIESETFCLDPAAVEANITQHTKAIMAIDIFGQSADMDSLKDLADRHNLKIISDSAQAPGAKYKGKHAGTLAHVGGFSLNYHKHIHTGEGGIVVTNDENIAERLKLIRNHAEAVVGKMGIQDFSNMVGYNFRLGEIECAIGIEQLKKLDGLISGRVKAADRLTAGLSNLKGLSAPTIRKDCTHVYYVYPMLIDEDSLGVSAPRIAEALRAEGVLGLSTSYQNLHLLPMYQRKIAFGSRGFPWNSDIARRKVSYEKGICPVAERLNGNGFLGLGMCKFELNDDDVDLIIAAFQKVWGKLSAL